MYFFNKKRNLILFIFISTLLLIVGNIVEADTNGAWLYPKDIRGGIFGSDEQVSNMNFTFINPIYFGEKLLSLSNQNYFINISGISKLNDSASNNSSITFGFIENLILGIPSCSGKLYTNSSGNILCGIDNINDADSNPTNELQNLNSVLTLGNDAGNKRIINVLDPINPNDVVTKHYFDKEILDLENQINAISNLDCPTGYILVPGNPTLGTSDFCVMKFEAKNVNGIAISQADLTPWTNINQLDARSECNNLGKGYHLITDKEWVTIARNIEEVTTNWVDGNIGSLVSNGGGLKRGNVGYNDVVSYKISTSTIFKTSASVDFGTNRNTLALLVLSNGEEIWDLSGNVWEWDNDSFENIDADLDQGDSAWHQWTDISTYLYLQSIHQNYNSNYGIGTVSTSNSDANPSGTTHGFYRGGSYFSLTDGGIFSLFLGNAPTVDSGVTGFRCVYKP